MKITIFGTGYVGLVTGTCLADVGHDVICVDINEQKVKDLNQGIVGIYEPGLENLVLKNKDAGRLSFTNQAEQAVSQANLIMIAVGTPQDEDGSADLQHVVAVGKTIGTFMQEDKHVVIKSTVPVGTCDTVEKAIQEVLAERNASLSVSVISNPEFLKEGDAINDFVKPERIVVGINEKIFNKDTKSTDQTLMEELYEPFNRNHNRVIFMGRRSSELTKYAANAMLATKISFINEMSRIAESLGADIASVREGIGSDKRIGYHFIYPGCGFGGSCFPKDVKAIQYFAKEAGVEATLISAVDQVNNTQKQVLFKHICHHYQTEQSHSNLNNKTFAVWGLSFKPNTDDMREASSITLIKALINAGAKVKAYDPKAMHEAERPFKEELASGNLTLCESMYEACQDVDAIVLCTEWKEFQAPDFDKISQNISEKVIFDGRNQYSPERMAESGWQYYGIGRGLSVKSF